jgi:hypothetical protein
MLGSTHLGLPFSPTKKPRTEASRQEAPLQQQAAHQQVQSISAANGDELITMGQELQRQQPVILPPEEIQRPSHPAPDQWAPIHR